MRIIISLIALLILGSGDAAAQQMHTSSVKFPCKEFQVNHVRYQHGRWFWDMYDELGRVGMEMPGLEAKGDPENGTRFLNGLTHNGSVKICGRENGLPDFYVDTDAESLRELMVEKGLAKTIEGH